jgi:hypothetical protein
VYMVWTIADIAVGDAGHESTQHVMMKITAALAVLLTTGVPQTLIHAVRGGFGPNGSASWHIYRTTNASHTRTPPLLRQYAMQLWQHLTGEHREPTSYSTMPATLVLAVPHAVRVDNEPVFRLGGVAPRLGESTARCDQATMVRQPRLLMQETLEEQQEEQPAPQQEEQQAPQQEEQEAPQLGEQQAPQLGEQQAPQQEEQQAPQRTTATRTFEQQQTTETRAPQQQNTTAIRVPQQQQQPTTSRAPQSPPDAAGTMDRVEVSPGTFRDLLTVAGGDHTRQMDVVKRFRATRGPEAAQPRPEETQPRNLFGVTRTPSTDSVSSSLSAGSNSNRRRCRFHFGRGCDNGEACPYSHSVQ